VGQEARCTARVGHRVSEGTALLETDELVFRGSFRLAVPFRQVESIVAEGGRLALRLPDGKAVFEFDDARLAERWAERIRNPKSVLEKLGVKAGWKVAVVGVDDPGFVKEVETATGHRVLRRAGAGCDAIFLGVDDERGLAERLAKLRTSLTPDGALWIVRPKGVAAITEAGVMTAGKKAGLVDVKVVRFSDSHTAEKFVIPRDQRR
jgi:DUF3052 family protein